jgi:hypothetical protein
VVEPDSPRFVVDAMLGRLARWLRLLGYDALYDPAADDRALARCSAASGRILLTRDRGLLARRLVTRGLLIDDDHLAGQLRQVATEYGIALDPARCFTRCLACNAETREADGEDVAGRVPPYVLRTQQHFRSCPGCSRVYWAGSHREFALRQLTRLLGRP